ncbi:hypothetical protein FISHEDRAFT_62425 [Fistulina hepatica ATCC 64428]|nr:hypothetical protein FISHEDRAFT_62425 [Fistulina hepatica ATCC 64428]
MLLPVLVSRACLSEDLASITSNIYLTAFDLWRWDTTWHFDIRGLALVTTLVFSRLTVRCWRIVKVKKMKQILFFLFNIFHYNINWVLFHRTTMWIGEDSELVDLRRSVHNLVHRKYAHRLWALNKQNQTVTSP